MQQGSRGGSWKSPPSHQGFVHGVTCRLGAPNGSGSPRMCPVAAPQLSFPSSSCFGRVFPPPKHTIWGFGAFFPTAFPSGQQREQPLLGQAASSRSRWQPQNLTQPKSRLQGGTGRNPGSKKGRERGTETRGGTPKRGSSKGQSLGRWAGWQSPAGSGEVPRGSSGTEIHPCFLFFFPVLFKLGHFLNPDLQDDHTNKR